MVSSVEVKLLIETAGPFTSFSGINVKYGRQSILGGSLLVPIIIMESSKMLQARA